MLGSTCFRAIRDYFYLSYGLPTNDYLNYFFNKSPYSLARVPTIEAPLRGEILNRDSLVEYASSLAEQHHGQVAPSRRGSPKLFSRFEENNQLLEVCYQELISAAQNRESLTSGAEWLLDNYHIIEAQVRNIRRDFPRSYYHSLPKLLNGDYRDYPRVYHFAVELVSRTDANIDTELLNRFIGGYQAVSVLASGELWAIPIMLRITLIENLRRLAVASLAEKNQRIIADRFISQITTQENFSGTEILLLLAQQLKTEPTFLSSSAAIITRRLREQGSKSGLALRLLEEWFRERGQDVEDLARAEQSAQAANQVSISNCVTSLKRFSSLNWQDWVESVSAVNKILLDDPAKVYGSSDFPTRDTCRHSVERYARAMQCSEVEIATKVVALAQQVSADLHLSELEDQVPEQRFGHIGYYLAGKGREQFEQQIKFKVPAWTRCKRYFKQRAFAIYSSSILFLTFLFSLELLFYGLASGGSLFELVLLLALFVLPISELASNIVQWVSSHLVKPARISKLDFEHGVPRSCRTVVTVQMIFNDLDTISESISRLEVRYLANDDHNILFALLADLPDSVTEVDARDATIIAHATKLMTELNERHFLPECEARFLLLFRKRIWSPSENKYLGWERKRGKITEFNRLILGETNTTFEILVGNRVQLLGLKYVITLDGDTSLPRNVARELIGAIAHPLNRAIFDPQKNIVVEGYGLIQPRVSISMMSACKSRFSNTFLGQVGLDPYTTLTSDVYQDLFLEGSYVGKGIYDVQSFERALSGRVPDGTLLSHDLFEGAFARVALATDIEVFDEFPSCYFLYAQRIHRWIRGDWQLLPWIFGRIPNHKGVRYQTPLSALSRWKIIDNLRRSLVAPSCFLALGVGLSFFPGSQLVWLFLIILVLAFPIYANVANAMVGSTKGLSIVSYITRVVRDAVKHTVQMICLLSFLPQQAYLIIHAITVTLYRVMFSKKNLLRWKVACFAESSLKAGECLSSFYQMSAGLSFALIGLILAVSFAPQLSIYVLVLTILWTASPLLALWLSRPLKRTQSLLSAEQQKKLSRIGWETWSYFSELMNQENNYLVPDNIQLVPNRVVAERTSPTNIGLSLLSVVSAYDLGYVSLVDCIERLEKTFITLSKLERVHGHFLNWYQIRTLLPLNPRYISLVDSGNFIGHLVAVRVALTQFKVAAIITESNWKHLREQIEYFLPLSRKRASHLYAELDVLHRASSSFSCSLPALYELLSSIENFVLSINQQSELCSGFSLEAKRDFNRFISELTQWVQLKGLLNWLPLYQLNQDAIEQSLRASNNVSLLNTHSQVTSLLTNEIPSIKVLAEVCEKISLLISSDSESKHSELAEALAQAQDFLILTTDCIDSLFAQSDQIIAETDFAFLYDLEKQLFSIGFHVDSGQRDNSYYDLLASESRLASFVAIATGQIPQKHWFMLGRSLVSSSGGPALVSWSATMFEYLMPLLVMYDYPQTLLSETYRAVVRAQRDYVVGRNIPWGISESAYSVVDFEKTYQYKAFGLPALGLKRGLAEDLVISPYSTFLALLVDPVEALRNIEALELEGLRGEFGFYEAVDYTSERLSQEESSHIVSSFLAHHQGMSLVAINNALNQSIMQVRFHADPWVRATELLLQERCPISAPTLLPKDNRIAKSISELDQERISKAEIYTSPHTIYPHTRVLSNGRYSVMLDNAGSGFSRFDGQIALTRWHEDAVIDQDGTYIFVRDLDDGRLWSVAYQPTRVEPETYEVIFNPDKVEYKRLDYGIFLHTEIVISPEDQVEVRRVTLTNISGRQRNLEVTSYAEVALALRAADRSHQAFSKMFIESEVNPEIDGVLLSRRGRSKNEAPLHMMHILTARTVWQPTEYETSRYEFIGRGNNISNPVIFESRKKLSATSGAVLDPIFSLRTRVELGPSQSESVVFITGFAASRTDLLNLAQRYHDLHSVTRAFEMAWTQSHVELRYEQFSVGQSHTFQHLMSAVIFNIDRVRGSSEAILKNRLAQSGFWRFGLSGDLPIVLLRVDHPNEIELVKELLLAHQYCHSRKINFDLVIVDQYPGGYFQEFHNELDFLVRSGQSINLVDKQGGVHLRPASLLSKEEIILLEAIARVCLVGAKGSLASQLKFREKSKELPLPKKRLLLTGTKRNEQALPSVFAKELEFFNGFGGFNLEGSAYQINIQNRVLPPLPWVNVIANKDFGFIVSESGGGYTWSENSRENRITPWSNDPVSDPLGEVVYIRDIDQGVFWSPTPRPVSSSNKYTVQHAFGHSQFQTTEDGVESQLTISGSATEKVKWWHLKLNNRTAVSKKLEIFLYLDWTLGVDRSDSARNLISDFEVSSDFLYVTNNYNNEFSGRTVFLGSNLKIKSYTTSRAEFLGRHGDLAAPRILRSAANSSRLNLLPTSKTPIYLSGKTGAGFDSCGLIKVEVELTAGQESVVQFYLGEASGLDQAKDAAIRFKSVRFRSAELLKVEQYWQESLGALQVKTPDRAFDIMLNGWLLYQTLSCRIFARSGFYQSGGAIGFRDQLQDSLALLYSNPGLTRNQILLHASHQFIEGDVQHWWHPPTGRGVRTRISDDYLWLPYVVDRYLEATADFDILDQQVPFIESPVLEPHEMESYQVPRVSSHTASLYEHCQLALDRALTMLGSHGLPLMFGGDWNDGMNEVGKDGKGESVWLAWFLSDCLRRFSKMVDLRGDLVRAANYRAQASELVAAVERSAWDGNWYMRAFFDDGSVLGSANNQECKIDSLTQSWSVINGQGQVERQAQAMQSVCNELVLKKEKVIALLTPAFDQAETEPGYIKGYLPGVRENGGQYTHAAAWVVMAKAIQGQGTEALRLFSMLNPINHATNQTEALTYKTEPYVLCGDVYTSPAHKGRGGWSWYTGSSGWMYQVGIEHILGLKIYSDFFTVNPCIAASWKEFSFEYQRNDLKYKISIKNPDGVEKGVRSILVNGLPCDNFKISAPDSEITKASVVNVEVLMGNPDEKTT